MTIREVFPVCRYNLSASRCYWPAHFSIAGSYRMPAAKTCLDTVRQALCARITHVHTLSTTTVLFDLIKSDFDRKRELYHHHGSWFVRWVKNFIDPGGLALLVYRFGSWVNQLKIPVVKQCLRLLYIAVKMPVVLGFGIYIPSKATIGKGFVIHNMNGIFISTGVIGDDCTVQQGVTIGAIRPNKWQGKPRPPRLGKNVYLGAGAKCSETSPSATTLW